MVTALDFRYDCSPNYLELWPASMAEWDVGIDREIFSTIILSLHQLNQEEQLSVSGERKCTTTG